MFWFWGNLIRTPVKLIGVEFANFCSVILLILPDKLIHHFPHLSNRVQLANGDVLDPNDNMEILFALCVVVFMLDTLFEESVHQQMVHTLLNWCRHFRLFVQGKELFNHLHATFIQSVH
jgi:hypothetical protein